MSFIQVRLTISSCCNIGWSYSALSRAEMFFRFFIYFTDNFNGPVSFKKLWLIAPFNNYEKYFQDVMVVSTEPAIHIILPRRTSLTSTMNWIGSSFCSHRGNELLRPSLSRARKKLVASASWSWFATPSFGQNILSWRTHAFLFIFVSTVTCFSKVPNVHDSPPR